MGVAMRPNVAARREERSATRRQRQAEDGLSTPFFRTHAAMPASGRGAPLRSGCLSQVRGRGSRGEGPKKRNTRRQGPHDGEQAIGESALSKLGRTYVSVRRASPDRFVLSVSRSDGPGNGRWRIDLSHETCAADSAPARDFFSFLNFCGGAKSLKAQKAVSVWPPKPRLVCILLAFQGGKRCLVAGRSASR